mmetsp:Transcript_10187/g.17682  ORF Transcript_10187/g.17682 Transcript_10187/m.17682 type:complete len:240 (-) Transcript_10187:987-1706(-)
MPGLTIITRFINESGRWNSVKILTTAAGGNRDPHCRLNRRKTPRLAKVAGNKKTIVFRNCGQILTTATGCDIKVVANSRQRNIPRNTVVLRSVNIAFNGASHYILTALTARHRRVLNGWSGCGQPSVRTSRQGGGCRRNRQLRIVLTCHSVNSLMVITVPRQTVTAERCVIQRDGWNGSRSHPRGTEIVRREKTIISTSDKVSTAAGNKVMPIQVRGRSDIPRSTIVTGSVNRAVSENC